jgi:type I restriction-modification system DNA methylase subunit
MNSKVRTTNWKGDAEIQKRADKIIEKRPWLRTKWEEQEKQKEQKKTDDKTEDSVPQVHIKVDRSWPYSTHAEQWRKRGFLCSN